MTSKESVVALCDIGLCALRGYACANGNVKRLIYLSQAIGALSMLYKREELDGLGMRFEDGRKALFNDLAIHYACLFSTAPIYAYTKNGIVLFDELPVPGAINMLRTLRKAMRAKAGRRRRRNACRAAGSSQPG